ncbi:MAG: nucleotidyltransferase domain-containing protein [Pseudomonadota bacterium]
MKSLHTASLVEKDVKAIEAAAALLKRDFHAIEVRLFGSKARGDDTIESDIDLLVITPGKVTWRERDHMTDALYDIQLKHDVVISLLVVSDDEWKNGLITALPIHEIIEREGIAA